MFIQEHGMDSVVCGKMLVAEMDTRLIDPFMVKGIV